MGSVHVCGVARLPRAEYWLFDPRPVMQGSRSDLSRDAKSRYTQELSCPQQPNSESNPCHKAQGQVN